MLFSWIRKSVRNAVIDGLNDALSELVGATADAHQAPQMPTVRLMLPGPVEPEAEEEEPERKGRARKSI